MQVDKFIATLPVQKCTGFFYFQKQNEGRTIMTIEKYFAELSRMLGKNEIQTAPPERNTLPILLGIHPACRVEPGGELCKFPGDLDSPEAGDFYTSR